MIFLYLECPTLNQRRIPSWNVLDIGVQLIVEQLGRYIDSTLSKEREKEEAEAALLSVTRGR